MVHYNDADLSIQILPAIKEISILYIPIQIGNPYLPASPTQDLVFSLSCTYSEVNALRITSVG